MSKHDIRWIQRFNNFRKALEKLGEAITGYRYENISDLEKEGLIQRFEYTFELGWKTLQDLLYYKGYHDIKGPNPVLKQALQDGYIEGEESWRKMKEARELTAHTYDEDRANDIAAKIAETYFRLLLDLKNRLDNELPKE